MRMFGGAEDHDGQLIWICSYPKSGNTWMRLLLRSYFGYLCIDHDETNDAEKYWYQEVSPMPISGLSTTFQMRLRPAAMAHMQYVFGGQGPTVVKSHWCSGAYQEIPFFAPDWVDQVIYIHRDPRDVLPSLADHTGNDLAGAREFMDNETGELGPDKHMVQFLSSWQQHVGSWMKQERVPVMRTSYEEMQEDAGRELRRVVETCGFQVDTEGIEEAVEQCRFDRLQKLEEEEGFVEQSDQQERFFRKGQVGGWRDEVPEEIIRELERDQIKGMQHLGYEPEVFDG